MKNIIDIEHHMSIYVPLTQISENFMQKNLSSRGQEVPIVNNRKCIFTQCVSEELCILYDCAPSQQCIYTCIVQL